ncbi:hypothetical protein GQ457_03G021350 [Hibiscus cannabinus]
MSQSIDKILYFNGAHYSHWKNRMMIFLQSIDNNLWDIIEDGPTIPMKRVGEIYVPKERHEWSNQERKPEKLEVIHEGTNEVNETKISLLNHNYENFKMDPNEDIEAMLNWFSIIVNELKGFGEAISEDKLVQKLI